MNRLFEALAHEKSIGRRQRLIRQFLNSTDITDFLPEGEHILPEIAARYPLGKNDGLIVVGERYCTTYQNLHTHKAHTHRPVYVIGIISKQDRGFRDGNCVLVVGPSYKIPKMETVSIVNGACVRAIAPYVAQPA